MSDLVSLLPWLVSAWIAAIGLFGMATSRNLIHLVVCLSVFQTSVWLLLLTIGYEEGATAPIFENLKADAEVVDPVMQAYSVTGIVVSIAVQAILLGLAVQIHKRQGTLDPESLDALRG